MLEEFYETLSTVSVSALTGEGMDELFEAAKRCRSEYMADYKPDLDRRRAVSPHLPVHRFLVACCRVGMSLNALGNHAAAWKLLYATSLSQAALMQCLAIVQERTKVEMDRRAAELGNLKLDRLSEQ